MQYNLQVKAFGFHGCLIVEIFNIFCIVQYTIMIMALPELLMFSIGPYTILTLALRNVKLENIYLSRKIILVVALERKQTSSFFSIINLVRAFHHKLDDLFCHYHKVSRSTWMTTKNKWSRHRSFLYRCDRSLGMHVLKLGIEIPNLKRNDWSTKLI